MATEFRIIDDDGVCRVQGTISPDPGSGGQFQAGNGQPQGTVTPDRTGAIYQDLTNGGLYSASGPTSADWIAIGGNTNVAPATTPGIYAGAGGIAMFGTSTGAVSGSEILMGLEAEGRCNIYFSEELRFSDWALNQPIYTVTLGNTTIFDANGVPRFTLNYGVGANADLDLTPDTGFQATIGLGGVGLAYDTTGALFRVTLSQNSDVATLEDAGSHAIISWTGNQELTFYNGTPRLQPTIAGALSAVTDAAAKAVLTSIIAALAGAAGVNLALDGTT